MAANGSTKLTIKKFVPGLQVDGYNYAIVMYNSREYYVQIDTLKFYTLEGGYSWDL